MKRLLCFLSIFLAFSSSGLCARASVLNQIPNQFELVAIAERRIVYITPYGKKYHTNDCIHTNATTLTTAKRARKDGYKQCSVCMP